MGEKMFRCQRGVLLYDLSREYVLGQVREYPAFAGKKRKVTAAVSAPVGQWALVGIPEDMPAYDFYNLACWLFGTPDEDEDDEQDEGISPLNVIAVHVSPAAPEQSYYALSSDDEDELDVVFRGRRDDGKGVKVDVVEGTLTLTKKPRGFALPLAEYLAERGVPVPLRPGPEGFAFEPEELLTIKVNVD